ncbi:AcrR family transcriptional regulator [Spinactinospora alkalitolerans]|uniref:AcrR family transcriptional regulator n=1 Tax=Spinactinospora alkalitolerans TaxID=687207 RepID=A0A852TZT4_9ACTN|nr:TetR family transcriptional regulator [Spinactinospora alkalitolerans]NYE47474.1 AcrR family transcriptional regulator [Spinactinospora alkalitolerans]
MDSAAPTDDAPADAAPAGEGGGRRARSAGSAKSEQTRALILETAMRLFQERGYDRTTMRAIAKEAGVSVGNAYYYFGSKEHLIQGFYDRITREHSARATPALAGRRDFGERLGTALTTWLDTAEPYHGFATQFFRNAADPSSPLSPLSEESRPARATAVSLYREVLTGSGLKIDDELAELLPELLWLLQMGVVMFWVFDRTPGCERSRRFVRRCTPLVARLVSLSRYRILRPIVRDVEGLIRDFVTPSTPSADPGGTPR